MDIYIIMYILYVIYMIHKLANVLTAASILGGHEYDNNINTSSYIIIS